MTDFSLASIAEEINSLNGVNFVGGSANWETAESVKDVIAAMDKCSNLKFLNLEGNTLGVKSAEVIGNALAKHPEFQEALWKDLFTGRLKSEIPLALQAMGKGIINAGAKLAILDCSDNALGPNGMKGLVDLIKSESCYSLKELRLNNCGLGIGGAKMLAGALNECLEKSIQKGTPLSLRTFIAGRNRLENEGAKVLAAVFAKIGTLEVVSIPQNGIYHDGISALAEAFKQNLNMRVLNLNDNTVTWRGAKSLSAALSMMTNLEELNLGDCLLKTRGLNIIAENMMDEYNDLEIIDVSSNEIRVNGFLNFIYAIGANPNIQKLNFDGNYLNEDDCKDIKEILIEYGKQDALGETFEESQEPDDEEENEGEDDEEDYDEEEEDEVEDNDYYDDDANNDTVENSVSFGQNKSLNESVTFVGTEARPPTVETFCNTPNPTLKMFNDIKENNRLSAFREHLKSIEDDKNYLIYLVYTILKCSALGSQSEELKDISLALYKDCVEYAERTHQITRIRNFFLIQLGLLKCEDKAFKPSFDIPSCRSVLSAAMKQKIFPETLETTFKLFLEKHDQ